MSEKSAETEQDEAKQEGLERGDDMTPPPPGGGKDRPDDDGDGDAD